MWYTVGCFSADKAMYCMYLVISPSPASKARFPFLLTGVAVHITANSSVSGFCYNCIHFAYAEILFYLTERYQPRKIALVMYTHSACKTFASFSKQKTRSREIPTYCVLVNTW